MIIIYSNLVLSLETVKDCRHKKGLIPILVQLDNGIRKFVVVLNNAILFRFWGVGRFPIALS